LSELIIGDMHTHERFLVIYVDSGFYVF